MATKTADKGATQTWGKMRVRGIARDFDDIVIHAKNRHGPFRANIDDTVTDGVITRAIDGSSTIEITALDPARNIQQKILGAERFDLELDGLWFRLHAVKKQGEMLTMTFIDRPIAYLMERKYKGPRKAFRDKVTRAEFVRHLVRVVKEERIPLYIPELHEKQPIIGNQHEHLSFDMSSGDKKGGAGKVSGAGGVDTHDGITVKHVKATTTQLHNINGVLDTGVSLGASRKVLICSIMTITQESTAQNLSGGDQDSVGLFQQRRSMGWPASRDIHKDATAFFKKAIALDKKNPGMSKDRICQGVQISGTPTAYRAWVHEAAHTVDQYLGGKGGVDLRQQGSATLTTFKRYSFEQKRNETLWKCIQRLAEEVNWKAFVSAGIFYYVSEPVFFQQKTAMHINEYDPGIDSIDYDWNMGKRVQSCTVTGRAKDWAAPPGTVVRIKENFAFPEVETRYIVSSIRSNLFTPDVEITLTRPLQPKEEPAPEKVTKTVQFGDAGGLGGGKGGDGSNGYVFPFSKYTEGRVDMGVDYTGSGHILSPTDAEVVATSSPGWPNGGAGPSGRGIVLKVLNGFKKGKYIYIYEGIIVHAHRGQKVRAGERVAEFYPGSSIEIGWYCPHLNNACASTHYSEGQRTAEGRDMLRWLHKLPKK